MSVPKQEKQLKKKCLLPDDGANVNAALTARGKVKHFIKKIAWI